jgi:hypothetical protein
MQNRYRGPSFTESTRQGETMSALEEIRNGWKLDSRSEDSARYFFHLTEAASIENGKRAYVIGRKGTGKTALAEFIAAKREAKTFSTKLSFKNFPFNELYSLTNAGYTPPNQYITLWKYIIYSVVCSQMASNEGLDQSILKPLRQLYGADPASKLSQWVQTWTATDFSLQVLGTGGSAKGVLQKTSDTWIGKVETLEAAILKYLDDSTYFIVFDELDEDYKNIVDKQQYQSYTHLLTGLFKAVQEIKGRFKDANHRVFPVILLRDDIYSVIHDPDKTKWDDFKLELDWDRAKIKQLLAFRISRSISPIEETLPFDKAWIQIFLPKPVHMGNEKQREMDIFSFIERSTHLRPRDFVRYIQACAEATPQQYNRITPNTVKSVDKSFSNYLKRELIDEVHGVIPEIDNVLEVFSQIRKQTLTIAEFKKEYERKLSQGSVTERDVDWILKILFLFSVIGNQPKQKTQTVFRYLNRDAELNFSELIVVHRGLFKALQIL